MASGPLDESRAEASQSERDALAERCAAAEQRVAALTAELAAARERIAQLEGAGESPISIFDADTGAGLGLSRDGSDPRVLSLILAATAVVAGMVALLALLNDNLNTTFGFAMIVATLILAYAAARTRVGAVDVDISTGVVHIKKGESSYRFDLRNAGTQVEMDGQPGDSYWQVRFHRKGMDDFVVDGNMVNAQEFVRRLREHRPEL